MLLGPPALALDEDGFTDKLAETWGMSELERAGEEYTGGARIGQDLDVGGSLKQIGEKGMDSLEGLVKSTLRSCLLILVITLLCGLAEGMEASTGGDPLKLTTLLGMGEETISNMEALGDILLPAVSMATAASGTPASAAVKYGITIIFSDLLIRLIHRLLIPLCYAYVAAGVAWAALGNEGLKRVGALLKWLITILLSVFLLAFIAYLNLSGVISGGADAATVKAAKFTISNMVPVVGGVISDTAETLLAGAGVLRNAAGVFGMLAVLGICMVPFLNLGLHYLLYKCTAALAATASGNGRVTGLIEQLSTAFGLILAMTGSCGVLLVVAMISTVSTVAG